MEYRTVKGQASAEFEEKKSIFIGSIARVSNEDEARDFINSIKAEHREARHNVYAYIIGANCSIQRYSDDGEPQGTGGIPVLEVIKRNNLTDTVIVVTRYFGGVLLGASGLVRAYSKAAAMAVKEASIVEKVKAVMLRIKIDYDMLGKIQYTFSKNNWQIDNIEYSDMVELTIICEKEKLEEIRETLMDIANNKFTLLDQKEDIYFKENNKFLIDL
ncbi:IMPACT family member YigZ [Clostridium sp. N3C]|uniref:YigZ family protein n=1 Tax=Clostridium sp. N3C TaxID=1776758 RepID=UPI00092E0065|nr:YigZ family protein [Clostridium sp. N3C]SCN21482.1 IMPACT family member YigZ [Clostridium sp. N3C]